MNISKIASLNGGQDGAIYGKFLFRFDHLGRCDVYSTDAFEQNSNFSALSSFTLDKTDLIVPHGNAVVFGNEFYAADDEFPLLYNNIYNNYGDKADKKCGTACVYRIQRNGMSFTSTLVQIIEVGFTDEKGLWRSEGETEDVRPYGNFVVDNDNSRLYAFVMRDADRKTRYFSFKLPKLSDGKLDTEYGVNRVKLTQDDIVAYFDVPYHNFVQGACFYGGKVYSVEGFHESIHPAVRIIDPDKKEQTLYFDLYEAGYTHEAEFVDFYKGECIYGDAHGNYFKLEF